MTTRITYGALALLIYITSAGIVVNRHFCQNQLKSFRFFLAAGNCHTSGTAPVCPMHGESKGSDSEKKNCCDDQTDYVKAEQEQYLQVVRNPITMPVIALVRPYFGFTAMFPQRDRKTLYFLNFRPPPIIVDLQISLQTFLC